MGVVRLLIDGIIEVIGIIGILVLGDGDDIGVVIGIIFVVVVEVIFFELVVCGCDDGVGDGWIVWELMFVLEFDDGDDVIDMIFVVEGWILEIGFGVVVDVVGVGNSFVVLLGCIFGFGFVGMRLVLFVGGLVVFLVRLFVIFCVMLDIRVFVLFW